jgi:PilZ domain
MSDRTTPLPADDPKGIERRASTRYPCNLATSCRLAAAIKGQEHSARVRNISAGGVSLVISHGFSSDDILAVELRSMPRNFARQLKVRVIYCIEHPSGDYIVGGSFISPLTEDEVTAFLG